jgi:hypothetical protein
MHDLLRRPSVNNQSVDSSTLLNEPREDLEQKVLWLKNKLDHATALNDSMRFKTEPEVQAAKE